MTFKDLLKKRGKTKEDEKPANTSPLGPSPAEFTFIRSTTNTQEVISPPSFPNEKAPESNTETSPNSKRRSRFRASSAASTGSRNSNNSEKRLPRLHLRSHSHASSASSVNVPPDLPIIKDGCDDGEDGEAKWEERATILAQKNPNTRSRSSTLPDKRRLSNFSEEVLYTQGRDGDRPAVTRNVSDAQGDVGSSQTKQAKLKLTSKQENIQEAIRLHESGGMLIGLGCCRSLPQTWTNNVCNLFQICSDRLRCLAGWLKAMQWLRSSTASHSGQFAPPCAGYGV